MNPSLPRPHRKVADEFYNDVKVECTFIHIPDAARFYLYRIPLIGASRQQGTQFLFSCRTGGLVAGRTHRVRVLPSAGRRFCLQ